MTPLEIIRDYLDLRGKLSTVEVQNPQFYNTEYYNKLLQNIAEKEKEFLEAIKQIIRNEI